MLVFRKTPNLQAHDYVLSQKPDEAARWVIQFKTKKAQQQLKWILGNERLIARDAGRAWIDAAASTDQPGLFTAVQEQLGLKLEATKGLVQVLVIDGVQKPAEN